MTVLDRLVVVVVGVAMLGGLGACKPGLRRIGPGQDSSTDGLSDAPSDAPSNDLPATDDSASPTDVPPTAGADATDRPAATDGPGTVDGAADGAIEMPVIPACPSGKHMCPGGCVDNISIQTCGTSCTPCQAPTDGTATCDGMSCGGSCLAGKKLCLGACIDMAAACSGQCPAMQHACGGLCPSVTDPTACGTSCLTCAVPTGATQATCDGVKCDFQCGTGTHKCGLKCPSDTDVTACGTACVVCPADLNGTAQCVGGVCGIVCKVGYHLCSGLCVKDSDVANCGATSCAACSMPMGGAATCDGIACTPTCPGGMKLCAGVCINMAAACSGVCPSGTHNCSGICAMNTSVDSCGATSCASCPRPTGASATSCDGTTCDFTCGPGTHRCGTRCAADNDATGCGTACVNCPTDPNGTAACVAGTCGVMCKNAFHVCSGLCVDNKANATCGPTDNTSCTACQAPTGNGSVMCDGLTCVPSCPSTSKLCNGACIPMAMACGGMCPAATHNCSGFCLSNTDVGSCGTQCAPCPVPPSHGQATCGTDGTCGIGCDATFRRCVGTTVCVSNSAPACCISSDCTAGPTGTVGACNANICSYSCNAPTFKQCGSMCIPMATCCTPCTNGFTCKAGVCPTSCTADADCTANHFCRNGACLGKITQISAGGAFACSLHDDGAVRCWGFNGDGELGTPGLPGPRPLVVPLPMAATQVVAGNRMGCAVLADTSLWCWGEPDGLNISGPAPYAGLTGVANMSLSSDVGGCAVLTPSRTVTCWGRNEFGQLGQGTVDIGATPTTFPPMTVPGLTNVLTVSHASSHVCVLISGGTMSCWGLNRSGEIGNGMYMPGTITVIPSPVPSPTVVAGISGATQIAAGPVSSYALLGGTNSGMLVSWGDGSYVGRGTTPPLFFTPGRIGTAAFASVSSMNTSCAVTTPGGNVICWGINLFGQAGVPASGTILYDPVQVPNVQGASGVASGSDFACAVTDAALGVMCWGNNSLGQLGNGTSGAGGNIPTAVAW